LTTNLTRMNWFQIIGKRCFSQGNFGLPATGASSHI
jgi:hypothetical protein